MRFIFLGLNEFSITLGMDKWNGLHVPTPVLWALRDAGFTSPTPIQAQILPSAIRDQMDIVGAAETVTVFYNVVLAFKVYKMYRGHKVFVKNYKRL